MRPVYDGKRFGIDGHRGEAGFAALMKWQLSGKRARWPKWIEDVSHPPLSERIHDDSLRATWIGHSTVLVQTAGLNILTDPFLSARASPMRWAGPRRVRAPGLQPHSLPPIDIILLSHNHYDHMDLPGLKALSRHHDPHVVTPLGNGRYIRRARTGFEITELGWGDSITRGSAAITVVPALHWSKRGLFDANRALWGGFVIETPGGIIYFAGDTGFGNGQIFEDIHRTFGSPRLSLLPIGACEPRWFMKAQHMNPEEAVAAHLLLRSRRSLAIHHATIQLTDEAIDAPANDLQAALKERGLEPGAFLVPGIGQPVAIP